MAEVKTHDPKRTNLIYNGVAIVGFAKSGAIKTEKSEDNFTPVVGLMGDVVAAESYDDTGKITIKLLAGSSSIPFLSKEAKKRGDAAWVPCQMINLNTNAVSCGGTRCRITKAPPVEIGAEVGELEYTIFVADFKED